MTTSCAAQPNKVIVSSSSSSNCSWSSTTGSWHLLSSSRSSPGHYY
jgi:hypothetical protein